MCLVDQQSVEGRGMLESRTILPAFKQRDLVLTAISQNQVCKARERRHALCPVVLHLCQLECLVIFFCSSSYNPYIILRYNRLLLSLEKQVVARPHKFHSLF